jgi:hypothetical protein
MNNDKSNIAETPDTDPRAQYDELDEKAILMDIAAQLDAIRRLLEHQQTGTDELSEPMYECTKCGTHVTAQERQDHARGTHNAPPGMVDELFTKVVKE